MAKYTNTIEYQISTKLDSKGLTQLQSQLKSVESSLRRISNNDLNDSLGFSEPIRQLQELNKALSSSFDSSLGMLNLKKFKGELEAAGVTAKGLGVAFENGGAQGKVAMNNLLGQIGKIDTGLKRTSTTMDKMFNTISNTVRWGIISSGFSAILNSLHQSVDYVKELDDSLTQIMLVTDYSRQQMNEYAKSANEAAKALGSTTVDVTRGTTIYSQQGYDIKQSQQLAELSIKLANASEQDSATTSDQITALMNAYNLDRNIEELSKALDSWALVANISAADVEELAKASEKAASSASTVGVSLDQMNAQIATIESVTRDAPEQIGNGLKTLYSRLTDIKLGETLEDGVNLGQVTGILDKIGVQVLDQMGNMRDAGDIIEDLMVVWDDLDRTAKEAAGQAIAGKYQLNRFYALMDNSDMYQQYKAGSIEATGTLDQMNEEYVNSLEGKTAQLQAGIEGIFNSLFTTDTVYPAIDAMKAFTEVIQTFIDALGGGGPVITGLISLIGKLFSTNIAQTINDANMNQRIEEAKRQNALSTTDTLRSLGFMDPETFQGQSNPELVNFILKGQNEWSNKMSSSQLETYNNLIDDIINSENQAAIEAEKLADAIKTAGIAAAATGDTSHGNNIYQLLEHFSNLDTSEGIKQRLEVFKQGAIEAKKYSESIKEVYSELQNLSDGELSNEQSRKVVIQSFELAKDALEDLRATGTLQTDTYRDMSEKLTGLSNDFKQVDITTEDAENELREFGTEAYNILQILQRLASGEIDEKHLIRILETGETSQAYYAARRQQAGAQLEAFGKGIGTQDKIESVINLTSAVGELSFAWQSFQSLGSIWENNDLSEGEKLLQTIINLSSVIYTLVSSAKQLKTAGIFSGIKNIFSGNDIKEAKENLETINEKLKEAKELKNRVDNKVEGAWQEHLTNQRNVRAGKSVKDMSAANSARIGKYQEEQAKAIEKVSIAEKEAAGASKALSSANLNLALSIGAVIAAIVITAIKAYGDMLEENRQKAQDLANQTKETAESLQSEISNWNKLYDSYKDTGVVSDELIESSKNLSSSLELVGGDALITAGNFDTLKDSIEKAADAKYEDAMNAARGALVAENDVINNLFKDLPFVGSENVNNQVRDAIMNARTKIDDSNPEWKALLMGFNPGDHEDAASSINKLTAAIQVLKEEQEGLSSDSDEYIQIADAIGVLTQTLNEEETAAAVQNMEAMFSNRIQDSEFKKELENLGTDVDAIFEKFASDSNTSEWFENAKNKGQEFSLVLQSLTNESQILAVSLAQADEAFSTKMQGKISATIQTQVDAGNLSVDQLGVEDVNQYAEIYTDELQKQLDNSGLTDNEKLQFLAEIDWNRSLEDIAAEIENINTEDLPKLEFEPTWTDRSDFSEEKTDSILKDTKMSESALDRMSSDIFKDAEGLGGRAQEIEKELEELYDTIEDGETPTEEQAEQIAELREEYEDLGDTAKDIATYNLQMNKGISNLVKNWKNYADVLSDDASKGTSDYYQVLGELDEIMSDILNIDIGVLPKSFYENADAIDAMRRAAEGSTSAIDDLRRIAAEEIILNLQFENLEENENINDLRQELYGLLNEFQGLLDDAPLGMTVDCQTDPFIQKLNELLEDSKITQEQASNILSSIGMDATIGQKTQKMEQHHEAWYPTFEVKTDEKTGMITDIIPGDPKKVTWDSIDDVAYPYIEGVAYTGPGIQTVGATSSGNAPRSTSGGGSGGRGGSGGGSGGSGGSEKTYEPKQKDPIEEEVDLYERVNTQLDDVQETLEGIEEEEDRLIGPDARANLNKQLDLLQREIDLQKQKLEIQKQERNDLASQLSSRFGVTFDSEGFISNYANVLKQLEQRYNDLVSEYNSATTEERQEELAKAIDDAKDNIDKFKDLYQRYDTLQGKEIKETQNDIEKLRDQIEDLRISAYKAAQSAIDDLKELRDNAAELLGLFTDYKSDSPFRATITDAAKLKNIFGGTKKEAINYYQTLIDRNQKLADSATDAASKAAYQSQVKFFKQQQRSAAKNPLGTGALGLASQDLARLQKWIDNPNAADNPFGQNTSALYEAYEDAYNRMRSLALEAEQAWEQLEKDIIEGYEKIAEQEEDMSKRFDRLTKNLETLGDVLTLVKGEDEYGDLAKIYQQIGQTTLVQAQQQKEILRAWQDRYNSIEDKTSDIAKTVREQMEAAEDKLIELQKSVVEAWQKAFENAIKEITAKENQRLLGVRSIEDTSSDWERDKKYAEDYYDDVQKAMAIEQLRLKYMDLLDDAQNSNLDIQNRIRDAMNDQVKYLEDQEHLSEFNVKYANAQLEILQKQIALEDARNNKNQMRLRRDTQGNYRYVYSANQDDVRDKEADLLQTEFDAYNMSNENRMNTYTEWLAYYQNYQQQREAIIQRMEQGDAEAADALRKLEEDFARDMAAYSEELGDSWNGMIGALTWMAETGTETIKESAEIAMQAIRDKTNESLNAVGIQWNETIDGAIESVQKLLSENTNATNEMIYTAQTYKDTITKDVAPLTTSSFTNIDAAVQSAAGSTRDLAQASRELQEALLGDNAQLAEAQRQLEKYRKQLDDVKNSSAITAQQLRRAQEELDRTKAENLNYRTQIDDLQYRIDHPGGDQSHGSSDDGGGSGSGGFRVGDMVGFHGWYYYDSLGTAPAGNWYVDQPHAVRIAEWSDVSLGGSQNTGPYTASLVATDGTWLGWVKPEQLFDTGGYTGEWNNNSGRIAMLHQKELVLNQTDTENILNAVNMVRNMADMLKLFTGISSMKGTSYNKLGGDTIEQRVEITAEFPNVQNSNEIEKALLNLADSAYQYSYR